jgi:hypothetical protein
MAAPAPQINSRSSTIEEILGTAGAAVKNFQTRATNTLTSGVGSVTTAESGSYILKIIYYLLMYSFFIFLILLLVHFAVKPIFRFIPGGKGVIGVPGTSDDKVYWNDRKQPVQKSAVPLDSDDLAAYPFENNFTVSIDLYVRKLPETNVKNRLILVKSKQPTGTNKTQTTFDSPPGTTDITLESYFNGKANMIMYLTETNDLVVTFYNRDINTKNITVYASRPIYNIPLYKPFRITVVVEDRIFTLYMNGKQVFQRIVPNTLAVDDSPQKFYSPPTWAHDPKQTIFLQNFHVWPRAISTSEVAQAVPALATAPDFDMPVEAGGTSCV